VTESVVLPSGFFGDAMSEYRAFVIGEDGHFVGCEPIVCSDDSEATQIAKRFANGHDVELWNGPRLVVRLDHTAPLE
jgi:hypothetical protein